MLTFPNAKINLGLNILEKRKDGYHNLESCFYPVPWTDSLEIIESSTLEFQTYGLEIPGDISANLCIKAYELIKKDFDIPPVQIHLLKSIPMGAGLGGGSANGAFMLKLLNKYYKLGIDTVTLQEYALQLGSDCPFFIENEPVIASGRGEVFQPIQLSLTGYFIALQNPGVHISTKEAFSGINPTATETSISETIQLPMSDWRENLTNDFETSIFLNHPEIKELKEDMYSAGAQYASMTGTGSTVYGVFKEKPQLRDSVILEL